MDVASKSSGTTLSSIATLKAVSNGVLKTLYVVIEPPPNPLIVNEDVAYSFLFRIAYPRSIVGRKALVRAYLNRLLQGVSEAIHSRVVLALICIDDAIVNLVFECAELVLIGSLVRITKPPPQCFGGIVIESLPFECF